MTRSRINPPDRYVRIRILDGDKILDETVVPSADSGRILDRWTDAARAEDPNRRVVSEAA